MTLDCFLPPFTPKPLPNATDRISSFALCALSVQQRKRAEIAPPEPWI